ncbi:conserved hypothetical protein [Histoplasma capsulatum G186AR]|uniref:Uncharacterized protein n=1 Tax=Ajellomyces capsulatus (strain G186AR / H82 / ATCC MYA-2454 / RMSCC 2432) TaxID=447093 RepID=C0NJH3_AJECG|nr:uncharacterized protein HCBG_03303 [Histoplasma capsulatum G186AR]EEH08014.1 conserved hypothetical protein [Histoplasma capsulatum G186AR]
MGESNGEAADVRVLAAVTRSMARKVENSGVVEQNSLKKTNAHATARLTDIEFIGEKGGAPGKLDEALHSENKVLLEEIHSLCGGLNGRSNLLPPTGSWATIVTGPWTQDPEAPGRQPKDDLTCVRISSRPTAEDNNDKDGGFARYLTTEAANNHIRSIFLSIQRHPAQSSTELGNDTKLVKPRFGIVVHRTPTEEFNPEDEKQQGISKIMEDNDLSARGCRIEDITWLKQKNLGTNHWASMAPSGSGAILKKQRNG